eukprot:TRINITY_DN2864_c0_g1_i6.p1 TRINITY_DN2864_c0_g1~~TRINITY_DN2864_c0_g1_i6.p1  ORF type:complete len:190 (-),score=11.56 TRINITY_DN2864_c0_g1_i6:275-844(-)
MLRGYTRTTLGNKSDDIFAGDIRSRLRASQQVAAAQRNQLPVPHGLANIKVVYHGYEYMSGPIRPGNCFYIQDLPLSATISQVKERLNRLCPEFGIMAMRIRVFDATTGCHCYPPRQATLHSLPVHHEVIKLELHSAAMTMETEVEPAIVKRRPDARPGGYAPYRYHPSTGYPHPLNLHLVEPPTIANI